MTRSEVRFLNRPQYNDLFMSSSFLQILIQNNKKTPKRLSLRLVMLSQILGMDSQQLAKPVSDQTALSAMLRSARLKYIELKLKIAEMKYRSSLRKTVDDHRLKAYQILEKARQLANKS